MIYAMLMLTYGMYSEKPAGTDDFLLMSGEDFLLNDFTNFLLMDI